MKLKKKKNENEKYGQREGELWWNKKITVFEKVKEFL